MLEGPSLDVTLFRITRVWVLRRNSRSGQVNLKEVRLHWGPGGEFRPRQISVCWIVYYSIPVAPPLAAPLALVQLL